MTVRLTEIAAADVREGDRAVIFDQVELVHEVRRTGGVVRLAGETTSLSLRADQPVQVER